MRPDTIAAVGPDFIREEDGLLVRVEEDAVPTRCIAQNKVREHQTANAIRKLTLETAQKACWYGRIQGALFVATAVFLWWVGSQL